LHSNYFEFANNPGLNVLDFGWHQNANAWWKITGYNGSFVPFKDFVFLRKDQNGSTPQAPIPQKLTNASTVYSANTDALVTPLTSLPSSQNINVNQMVSKGSGSIIPVPMTFQFENTTRDLPPQVTLNTSINGTVASLTAIVTDDRRVEKVEFYLDEKLLNIDSTPPYTASVDLSKGSRRYAYLYVKAYDGYMVVPTANETEPYIQSSYSKVVELGAEVLRGNQPLPVPPNPPANQVPQVNAGQDQSATLNSPVTVSLGGTVSDDGLPNPPGAVTTLWDQVSGPAPVFFVNPSAVDTTATFSDSGTYVLRLIANDGDLSASDDVTVTVNPPPQPPAELVPNLSVASGKPYEVVVDGLGSGASVFIDRGYTFTSIPGSVAGATYIKTANDDKRNTQVDFLTFSVNQGVTIYVAYDHRASSLPNWLSGWNKTGESIGTTDVSFNLYAREFSASSSVTLGGNMATGASGADSNYFVVVVPR
jgi:hypothetical protein